MAFFNPFCSQEAISHSNYCTLQQKDITIGEPANDRIKKTTQQVGSKLSSFVAELKKPRQTLGINTRKKSCSFGVYAQLGSADTTAGLCRDLARFLHEQQSQKRGNPTFMAVFCTKGNLSEEAFEEKVATQIRLLQKAAEPFYCVPESVKALAQTGNGAVLFGSKAFKVVSIYRHSSQGYLQFEYPMIAFHLQEAKATEQISSDRNHQPV